jgi:arsenate reductase
MKPKPRVLILCTANSARSQMGEGLLRILSQNQIDVSSAGTTPSQVNPYAVLAMADVGIDIRNHTSKSLNQYIHQEFDYVITVCDHAAETCPVFPGPAKRIHWSFPDPAAVEGSHEEKLAAFVRVRDAVEQQFRLWLAETNLLAK